MCCYRRSAFGFADQHCCGVVVLRLARTEAAHLKFSPSVQYGYLLAVEMMYPSSSIAKEGLTVWKAVQLGQLRFHGALLRRHHGCWSCLCLPQCSARSSHPLVSHGSAHLPAHPPVKRDIDQSDSGDLHNARIRSRHGRMGPGFLHEWTIDFPNEAIAQWYDTWTTAADQLLQAHLAQMSTQQRTSDSSATLTGVRLTRPTLSSQWYLANIDLREEPRAPSSSSVCDRDLLNTASPAQLLPALWHAQREL